MELTCLNLGKNKVEEEIKTVPVKTSALSRSLRIIALVVIPVLIGLTPVAIFWVQTEREIEDKKREIERLEKENEKLRKLLPIEKAKKDYRALSCRFQSQKREAARFPSDKELQENVMDAEKQWATFLENNVNSKPDENGVPLVEVELDDKNPQKSVIRFRGEQETYEIPPSVKKLTKNITWNNPVATPLENAANVLSVPKVGRNSPKSSEDSNNSTVSTLNRESSFPNQRRTVEVENEYPALQPL